MDSNMKRGSIISYFCGLIILFISLFLDWYIFQAFDTERQLVASWSYHIFFGWSTSLSKESFINYALRPESFAIPLFLNLLYIIVILISGYAIIVKATESSSVFTYIHVCLLIMVIFYCVMFPIFFLFPNQLFFPYVDYENTVTHFFHYQGIGLGYILHLVSIVFIFPYTFFSLMTMLKFEKEQHIAASSLNVQLKEIQEPLDLDTLIAEEQLQLKRRR